MATYFVQLLHTSDWWVSNFALSVLCSCQTYLPMSCVRKVVAVLGEEDGSCAECYNKERKVVAVQEAVHGKARGQPHCAGFQWCSVALVLSLSFSPSTLMLSFHFPSHPHLYFSASTFADLLQKQKRPSDSPDKKHIRVVRKTIGDAQ